MSGIDNEPPFSPARKRRRALSDISNTDKPLLQQKDRRLSLQFAVGRIPDSSEDNKVSRMSSETPEPVHASLPKPASLADMNFRGSSIPTLKKADRFERFITINESLNRKSTINVVGNKLLASAHIIAERKQASSKLRWEQLTQESKDLDHEIKATSEQLELCEEESYALGKLHRAMHTEAQMLRNLVEEQKSKFEYLLGQMTTRVEMKERKFNLQLKEHKNKGQSSCDDVKYEIRMELESAFLEGDMETEKDLAILEAKKTELELKLSDEKAANNAKLAVAKAAMQAELDKVSAEVNEEVSAAESRLQELQIEHDKVELENQALEVELSLQDEDTQRKATEISALEQTIQGYVSQKGQLEVDLERKTELFEAYKARERNCSEMEKAARAKYDAAKRKFDQYMSTRRLLEHTMAKLTGKHRVIVRMDGDLGLNFTFDKLFPYKYDPVQSLEWELLVQEALSGTQVSLLFLGSPQEEMCLQTVDVFSFLRLGQEKIKLNGWESTIYFQSILFDYHNTVSDLLNLASEVTVHSKNGRTKINSQRMLVKTAPEISNTLGKKVGPKGAYIYVFTVEGFNADKGETRSGTVFAIDISRLSVETQSEILKKERNSSLDVLGDLMHQQCLDYTSLDVCAIENLEDPEALALLTLLNTRVC